MGYLRQLFRANFETLIWICGLLYLALIDPTASGHLGFCVFKWVGLERCPGCGLGQSMSFLLHGDVYQSFQVHPLGLFALVILTLRILTLLKKSTQQIKYTIDAN